MVKNLSARVQFIMIEFSRETYGIFFHARYFHSYTTSNSKKAIKEIIDKPLSPSSHSKYRTASNFESGGQVTDFKGLPYLFNLGPVGTSCTSGDGVLKGEGDVLLSRGVLASRGMMWSSPKSPAKGKDCR